MHEIGLDTTSCNPTFGTPRNPNNDRYYSGGSSGGSAYSVAAGLVPFAMGNDGGGSIRIPAAFCGLYGLKTSHGRVSARPSSNLAKSTGVAGPIAANMIDLELAYRVMAQPDTLDSDACLFTEPGSVTIRSPSRKKVLGIFRPWFERADSPVQKACNDALDYLTSKVGYSIVDITIPMVHEGQLAHAMTILAEIASGIPDVSLLTAPNKVLVSCGKQTPAPDFLQAQKLRSLLMQHLSHLYNEHSGLIIVTPTTPNAGWPINESDLKYGCSDGNMSIRNMEYVWLANFAGCPAITAPVDYVDPAQGEGKVPIGLMGMGEWCSEDELMAFGYDLERWLQDGLADGRSKPSNWTDVMALAREGQ
jgi:Asp-tRNA(Asn)/Glu-tRNA(Gln) amidotransferase A subunit family amidase